MNEVILLVYTTCSHKAETLIFWYCYFVVCRAEQCSKAEADVRALEIELHTQTDAARRLRKQVWLHVALSYSSASPPHSCSDMYVYMRIHVNIPWHLTPLLDLCVCMHVYMRARVSILIFRFCLSCLYPLCVHATCCNLFTLYLHTTMKRQCLDLL